jgi:threonine dehydrogenase-like Zn-dependent dehydrogenase
MAAAENAQIQEGDTVPVWGAGPVGQFAITKAFTLGAARVISIDRVPERLSMSASLSAITVDYSEEHVNILTALEDITGGIGPDACIDAVSLEAHSTKLQGLYDTVKTARRSLDLIHKLQPATLVNDRIGVVADFVTPEQFIPKAIPTKDLRMRGADASIQKEKRFARLLEVL